MLCMKRSTFACSAYIFNNMLTETIKAIDSTVLSLLGKKTSERSVAARRTTVSSKSTFILSFFDMVSMETAEENRSQCLTHWRWRRRRRRGAFKQLLFVFLLGTQGREAREKEKEKSFMSPETLKWTDQFGDEGWCFSARPCTICSGFNLSGKSGLTWSFTPNAVDSLLGPASQKRRHHIWTSHLDHNSPEIPSCRFQHACCFSYCKWLP